MDINDHNVKVKGRTDQFKTISTPVTGVLHLRNRTMD